LSQPVVHASATGKARASGPGGRLIRGGTMTGRCESRAAEMDQTDRIGWGERGNKTMANRRLLSVVTALLLIAGSGQTALGAYTRSDLEQIERMITTQRWGVLKAYLDQHPDLLLGEHSLARELRHFSAAVDASGPSRFIFPQDLPSIDIIAAATDSY